VTLLTWSDLHHCLFEFQVVHRYTFSLWRDFCLKQYNFDLHMVQLMTSYFDASNVTVANSNHKNCLCFFDLHLSPPTLKKVPPPMPIISKVMFLSTITRLGSCCLHTDFWSVSTLHSMHLFFGCVVEKSGAFTCEWLMEETAESYILFQKLTHKYHFKLLGSGGTVLHYQHWFTCGSIVGLSLDQRNSSRTFLSFPS